jgi:hypothetical protein
MSKDTKPSQKRIDQFLTGPAALAVDAATSLSLAPSSHHVSPEEKTS